jgi:hypothetical protein
MSPGPATDQGDHAPPDAFQPSTNTGGNMANPLTLLMPVVPNTSPATIANALAAQQSAIETGLTNVGTVHFSRFLLLDSSQPNLQPTGSSSDNLVLGVITEYDGDFDVYIQDFVDQIGGVFNALLVFVVGGEKLTPVANNVAALTTFIQQNDASQNPSEPSLYSAYPQTVQQILAAFSQP